MGHDLDKDGRNGELTTIALPKNIESYGGRELGENIERANKEIARLSYLGRVWDRSRSQYTLKHLTCGNPHPWLRMRQISAELENRSIAIEGAKHAYMKAVIAAKMARSKAETCEDPLRQELLLVIASEKDSNARNILIKLEGSLKEISTLAQMHDKLREQVGDVTEAEFEKAQVKSHLSRVFQQAAWDVRSTGHIGAGNQEYFEQIGVSVAAAEKDVIDFVNAERQDRPDTTNMLHAWMYEMAEKYAKVANEKAAWLGFDADADLSLTYTPE